MADDKFDHINTVTMDMYHTGDPLSKPVTIKRVDKNLERFLSHCHRHSYPKKTTLIEAGQKPDVLYYIISGSVSVIMEDPEGHEIVLSYLKGQPISALGVEDYPQNTIERIKWKSP